MRPGTPLDLSGQWRVLHEVESSERKRYVGLKIEFLLSLAQFGGTLTGSGRKVAVNREVPPDDEVSLLEVGGRVAFPDVRLSLFERRETGSESGILGEIVWRAVGPDRLVGRFQVDVGDTRGSSEAMRVPRP